MTKVYWVKPTKMKADQLATPTKVQVTGKLNADKSSGIPPTTLLFDLDASPVTLGSGDSFDFPPFTDATVPAIAIDTSPSSGTMKFGGTLLIDQLAFGTNFTPDLDDTSGSFDFDTPIDVVFQNGTQQITVTFSYIAKQVF
jgi:hypothetical protein